MFLGGSRRSAMPTQTSPAIQDLSSLVTPVLEIASEFNPDRSLLPLGSLCGDPLFEVGLVRLTSSSTVIS